VSRGNDSLVGVYLILTGKKNDPYIGSSSEEVTKSLKDLTTMGKKKGYKVARSMDNGFGVIDLVWYIKFHSRLPPLRCGFIGLKDEQANIKDWNDKFLLPIVEEAIMRGIRSGMDRLFIVCQNEEIANSVTRQAKRLKSLGSLLQFDSYSSGLFLVGDSDA
jgi:hypothetical protein